MCLHLGISNSKQYLLHVTSTICHSMCQVFTSHMICWVKSGQESSYVMISCLKIKLMLQVSEEMCGGVCSVRLIFSNEMHNLVLKGSNLAVSNPVFCHCHGYWHIIGNVQEKILMSPLWKCHFSFFIVCYIFFESLYFRSCSVFT